MKKEKIASLWDEAAENPELEKVRGYYLTRLFLIPIEKAEKYLNEEPRVLKVDLWNEGIDFERNILQHLKGYDKKLYGIDISFKVCALAKKHTSNVNVSTGTIEALAFKSESFNMLLDLSTLDHMPKEKVGTVIAEYNRVLCQSGIFVLVFDWWGILWLIYMFYLEKVRRHSDYFFKNTTMQSRYIHPIQFMKTIIEEHNFIIKEEYCIDYTGWMWNRVTKPFWDKVTKDGYERILTLEYSNISKYFRPFAKQYVIIAQKKEISVFIIFLSLYYYKFS